MLLPFLVVLATALPWNPQAPPDAPAASEVDFEGIAEGFLARHGLAAEELTFEEVLASPAFARVGLAGFELYVPAASLEDPWVAEELENAARLLIDVQGRWLRWRVGEQGTALADDRKTLDKWVESWSLSRLRRCAKEGGSLYDQLGAKDKILSAQERLRNHALEAQPEQGMQGVSVLVLAPSRRDFVELAAVGGLLAANNRGILWSNGAIFLSATFVDWNLIVAMEYPAEASDPPRPFDGRPITEREDTELMQHVADRAACILMRREFARHGIMFFEESLGTNLVISSVGKDTLLAPGWDSNWQQSGASTSGYSRFVPGGNSAGGVLPKRQAGSGDFTVSGTVVGQYRKGGGEDFFRKVLRDGQKHGFKLVEEGDPLAKDRTAHFRLYSADKVKKIAITAPFLGASVEGKPLPPHEFLDDYEDLFRAYRALFVFWLRTGAAGSEGESSRRFAELLGGLAEREVGTGTEPVFEGVYGIPLSAPDPSTDSLEWRFLAWLSESP